MTEVWGTITSSCTARTVDEGIPSRSSTSLIVMGDSASTERVSPWCSISMRTALRGASQPYV
ncbi:uncharacterized protein METZ01_LOCUS132715 [marine metagenome]|uniref:Uncharacterized protein n=1 Tax=marine metagenome TaxID=408172 RepID=A0A381YTA5_9ZZZZ